MTFYRTSQEAVSDKFRAGMTFEVYELDRLVDSGWEAPLEVMSLEEIKDLASVYGPFIPSGNAWVTMPIEDFKTGEEIVYSFFVDRLDGSDISAEEYGFLSDLIVENGDVEMEKQSHHLWTAEADADGNVFVNRSTAEREDLDDLEYARAVSASAWGLFGAHLVDELDNPKLDLPKSIVARFESVAKVLKEDGDTPPSVKSWETLGSDYSVASINEVRQFVAHGMQTRQLSKEYSIPFVAAADLLDDIEIIGKTAVTDIVTRIKSGDQEVFEDYGTPAKKIAGLFDEVDQGLYKLAVDQSAKDYWISYYGEFGEQLVKDVKKRIRADIAHDWLVKNGVDQAAAEYWQNYFSEGGYGKALTETVPKKLSPSNVKKEDSEKEEKTAQASGSAQDVIDFVLGSLPPQFTEFMKPMITDLVNQIQMENPHAGTDEIMDEVQMRLEDVLEQGPPEEFMEEMSGPAPEFSESEFLEMTDPGEEPLSESEQALFNQLFG